ncbi:MAG: hypothetical protein HLUCCX21_03055 [Porphyrobacter sp. HL-46]|nr:MAG: hypothetical protein HLUCCX21_03055 [Porphyrobacter sp. HL-46]
MSTREFDIIVFGATGYTGRLVAEYLAHHYGPRDANDSGGPKWAMAGRSLAKLEQVRDEIGAPATTPLVVADADDSADLEAMCRRTRVVLTTVGPYQLYGDKLLAACVATGTDYADLCGEPAWMAEKIAEHQAAAERRGDHVDLAGREAALAEALKALASLSTEEQGEPEGEPLRDALTRLQGLRGAA